jgi:hypothetical protein
MHPTVSRLLLVLATLVALALALLGIRWAASPDEDAARDVPTATVQPLDRDSAAKDALRDQADAYQADARADFAATWAPHSAAQRQAQTIFDDLTKLRVTDLDLRYVDAVGGVPLERHEGFGGVGWSADVEVTWRQGGGDQAVGTVVTYAFVEEDGGASVADISDSENGREPMWLQGPLEVREGPRVAAVASTRADAAMVASELRTAARDLQGVLPDWRGQLVAYLPATSADLESLLGSAPGSYDGIAAVATTVDGAGSEAAQAAIVLNPDVFTSLGASGRHVVITHEATHLATDAVTVDVPLWVAEGFADYVGVGAVDVPVSVSARAALSQVDRLGPPRSLPANEDFAAGTRGLEATYELAWLAALLISDEYGEDRLIDFYESVVENPTDVEAAFVDELGTTEAEFTAAWRTHLEELAGDR